MRENIIFFVVNSDMFLRRSLQFLIRDFMINTDVCFSFVIHPSIATWSSIKNVVSSCGIESPTLLGSKRTFTMILAKSWMALKGRLLFRMNAYVNPNKARHSRRMAPLFQSLPAKLLRPRHCSSSFSIQVLLSQSTSTEVACTIPRSDDHGVRPVGPRAVSRRS